MFAQHLIEIISNSLHKSSSILSRDFGELRILQPSPFGTMEFSLASYRKFFFTLYKSLERITSQYIFDYPKKIFTPSGNFNNILNTREFLISNAKIRFPESFLIENEAALGRFTVNAIDSIINFSRCIPLFSCGVLVETIWTEDGDGAIVIDENDENKAINKIFKPLYAVVMEICSNTFYTATAGKGAYQDNNRIKTSQRTSLNECLLSIINFEKLLKIANSSPAINESTKVIASKFKNLSLNFHNTLNNMSTQLSLCYLASGKIDFFIDFHCQDIAEIKSSLLIAFEAGAVILDEKATELYEIPDSYQGILIGTTRAIKDKIVKALLG